MRAGHFFRARRMILLYHRVARAESDPWSLCVTPEHFAEHLEVIRKHSAVPLAQIQSSGRRFGSRGCSVAITFDDGYADNFTQAAPLLDRYGVPATFFIVSGYVGGNREFWWDELENIVFASALWSSPVQLTIDGITQRFQMESEAARERLFFVLYGFLQPLAHETRLELLDELSHRSPQIPRVRPSHRVMTRDEIGKLAGTNLFEIGAHTVTHPKLSAQPTATQRAEIQGSKTWLEDLLGKPVTSFAYPYGGPHYYTQVAVEAARDAGFRNACTTVARDVKKTDAPLELPRFNVTDMNGEEFENKYFY